VSAEAGPVQLVLVGTNHRHAPLSVRDRLAVGEHGRALVEGLIVHPSVAEVVGVGTCNRCELYLVGADTGALRQAAVERLVASSGVDPARLDSMLYTRHGAAAAEHLFAVAGGLDSLVPGEQQILSQIRDALAEGVASGTAGPVTNRLFAEALEAGKRVRHETAFGSGGASVASVAAERVRQELGELGGASVLILGAGKVAELVAANLAGRGAARMLVANRDPQRAAGLAERFGGEAVPFERLRDAIALADVVVASTAAAGHVVLPEHVPADRRRVFVDLGVPRNVEPALGARPDVVLVNVDQLEETVRQNIRLREGEADRARAIVAEHAAEFRGWLAALEVVPAITSLRALAEKIRLAELERVEGKWEGLTEQDRVRLDMVTRSILAKLLHRPTVRLKELAADSASEPYAVAVSELFGLSIRE
jgi:glutamyl-tRNA reductase